MKTRQMFDVVQLMEYWWRLALPFARDELGYSDFELGVLFERLCERHLALHQPRLYTLHASIGA